jgi:hypothetical protein
MSGGKANTTGLPQTYAQCDTLYELYCSPRSAILARPRLSGAGNSATGEENVQHWLDDDAPTQDKKSEYEAVSCPACTRLHFVNRSTGKTLGETRK